MKSFVHSLAVIFVTATTFSYAGGPLYTFNGKAYRYKSDTISYTLDRGPFGIFTSSQAQTLANASFKTWDDVVTSNVTFKHSIADTLLVDVNASNYLDYTTMTDFVYDGINPIIFDNDGSITEALFGTGASQSVIGFAGSGDKDNDGYFDEGESVMNGKLADGSINSFTLEEWKSTFVHEFGHFLGLDHTQINGEYSSDAAKTIYVPTMYPFATVNDVPLGDLNPDDIAAISNLYPAPSFFNTTGKITGTVTRVNASVVRGANVIAISTGADSLMNQISTVTDYFDQNNGMYTIIGLNPGSYIVRTEPINPNFTGGSSVGPYASSGVDISFQNPVIPEYYNGDNESGDPVVDNPSDRNPVIVNAGATTSNINFVANGKGTNLLTDDFNFSGSLVGNGWTAHSGIANILSTTAGLTFEGYPGSGIGNAVLVSNLGGQDVNKGIDEQTTNGSVVYASLLVKVIDTAVAKTGDYFFHLGHRTSSSSFSDFSARLFAKITGGSVNFGISNSNTVTYGSVNYVNSTTYLAIIKYTINTTGNDEVKLWIQSSTVPPSELDAGTPIVVNTTSLGQDNINAAAIRQGSATTSVQVVLDGITIRTKWPFSSTTGVNKTTILNPKEFELMQNYPNPFNPTTVIRFALPSSEIVTLKIFDVLGREITTLAVGQLDAGVHEIRFDAQQLSSGTYFYSIEAGTHRDIKKMILIK